MEKSRKALTIIFSVSLGLFIGYFLFSTGSGSVQSASLPPYRFISIEDFLVEATGVWNTNGSQEIPGVDVESSTAVSVECELYNNVCHEVVATLVKGEDQVLLYAPYIISYEIESRSKDRITARRDGGAAVITLDISLLSETIQKERLEEGGKLTKYSLVSGIK